MYLLSNNLLSIEIAAKGAELQSIYHVQNELEYLWSGDAKYWAKKSPVLFPIVGGLKNNIYKFQGQSYKLGRHGFARDSVFEVSERTSNSITFLLQSNEQTKLVYPFDFRFRVKYSVNNYRLSITFIVENKSKMEMFFSVGAHPAFTIPIEKNLQYNDYYLRFDVPEHADRWPLTTDGLIEAKPIPFLENESELPLRKELFYKDAIVFKQLQSRSISIVSSRSSHGVKVNFDGFPYLGIWAAKEANFICIEPWYGIADSIDSTGELTDKEGIIHLPIGETFEATYSIEVF